MRVTLIENLLYYTLFMMCVVGKESQSELTYVATASKGNYEEHLILRSEKRPFICQTGRFYLGLFGIYMKSIYRFANRQRKQT